MARERMKSPRLRLFVALDLPDGAREQIVAWQEEAFSGRRDLRLVPPYSLHLTLVFLGYQAERDVERIAESAFQERDGGPFELRPTELLEVPPRRPRLYAVGMDDAGERLGSWQAGLAERLQRDGFYEPEKRPFWPHLTVARFKQTERHRTGGARGPGGRGGRQARGPADQPAPLPELPEELQEPIEAARLTLYSSTLKPQGAVYEALARNELTGGGRATGGTGKGAGAAGPSEDQS
jgi:RNA 2',3'-cyclic 3'-phosphodiesterase